LLPFSVGRFASLRFRLKNMSQHIFQFESELQNSSQEAAPSSPSLSPTVSEKLERYGSSALSGVEHLTLIVGKEDLALTLVRHFGSIKALSRASIQQAPSIPAALQGGDFGCCALNVYNRRK
jgi:tartrate dehydratase beta subunit/fumarate hydratase class I family protein